MNVPQFVFYETTPVTQVLNNSVSVPPPTYSNCLPVLVDTLSAPTQTPLSVPTFQMSNSYPNMFSTPNPFPPQPLYFQPFQTFMPLTPMPFAPIQTVPQVPTLTLPGTNMSPECSPSPSPVARKCSKKSSGKGGQRNSNWRSKQDKILAVKDQLQQKYSALGKLVGPDHMLRGPDTVRCHVKSFTALCMIDGVLDEIMNHPLVNVKYIAVPLSRKNESQNKGLIVYIQTEDEEHIPIVQSIFAKYPEVTKKCEMAMPKAAIIAYKAKKQAELEKSLFPKQEDQKFENVRVDSLRYEAHISMINEGSVIGA